MEPKIMYHPNMGHRRVTTPEEEKRAIEQGFHEDPHKATVKLGNGDRLSPHQEPKKEEASAPEPPPLPAPPAPPLPPKPVTPPPVPPPAPSVMPPTQPLPPPMPKSGNVAAPPALPPDAPKG